MIQGRAGDEQSEIGPILKLDALDSRPGSGQLNRCEPELKSSNVVGIGKLKRVQVVTELGQSVAHQYPTPLPICKKIASFVLQAFTFLGQRNRSGLHVTEKDAASQRIDLLDRVRHRQVVFELLLGGCLIIKCQK